MLRQKIKSNLIRGDYGQIASLTGFSRIYVKKVMEGSRKNKIIMQAAKELIIERNASNQRIKSKLSKHAA